MSKSDRTGVTRRRIVGASALAAPLIRTAVLGCSNAAAQAPLRALAGVDRVTVMPGRTYLRGWAGYGDPPHPQGRHLPRGKQLPPRAEGAGPAIAVLWSKVSGPGAVRFEDPRAAVTTATFPKAGNYVLRLTARNGAASSSSTLAVRVEAPPPSTPLQPVYPTGFGVDSPFWNARFKALIVNWIPHCIEVIGRSDVRLGAGGIDNFEEAGKKLRGQAAGHHKGAVFSNAWVHQTVEAMSIALMVDPRGDPGMIAAQRLFRETLDNWIPKILAAQEPDGYLQTAFTLDRVARDGRRVESSRFQHWDAPHRDDHEGYVAGYFLEAAINHYQMSGRKDARLYQAAKRLADCWVRNIGPPPRKAWYDGHQEMEQALVRFGRFVNDVEGGGKGDDYVRLAKFLLDCRYTEAVRGVQDQQEYDQSHLPVVQQYEAVGHAVRATYTYSGMADVAVETRDPAYRSAALSIWDNIVHRKYYVTGGIGSGETVEGFGDDYSLPDNAYCESCSSCGMIFFHWKMNLAYQDARFADNYEETIYNALLGSLDLEGKKFYYTNPLDAKLGRSSWHGCPCCVGNIARTLLMLPTWMYAKAPDGIYVNMYAGSRITAGRVAGADVEIVQQTDYPWNGKVALKLNLSSPGKFVLRLRVPGRATSGLYLPEPEVQGIVSLKVNGLEVKPSVRSGYAAISRDWRSGDIVEAEFPMRVQRVRAVDRVGALRGKVALRYGPLIYNIEAVDQDIAKRLPRQSKLTTEWRGDLLGGVLAIRGRLADGSEMLAIPNYARLNRDSSLPAEAGPISGSPALYMGPQAKPAAAPAPRGAPPPAASIVWIAEV